MATQSSSIRVKGGKNPWNKKKKNVTAKPVAHSTQSNNNKQQNPTPPISQISSTNQWPNLQLGAKMNIATAPKKATEPILSPSHSGNNKYSNINHNNVNNINTTHSQPQPLSVGANSSSNRLVDAVAVSTLKSNAHHPQGTANGKGTGDGDADGKGDGDGDGADTVAVNASATCNAVQQSTMDVTPTKIQQPAAAAPKAQAPVSPADKPTKLNTPKQPRRRKPTPRTPTDMDSLGSSNNVTPRSAKQRKKKKKKNKRRKGGETNNSESNAAKSGKSTPSSKSSTISTDSSLNVTPIKVQTKLVMKPAMTKKLNSTDAPQTAAQMIKAANAALGHTQPLSNGHTSQLTTQTDNVSPPQPNGQRQELPPRPRQQHTRERRARGRENNRHGNDNGHDNNRAHARGGGRARGRGREQRDRGGYRQGQDDSPHNNSRGRGHNRGSFRARARGDRRGRGSSPRHNRNNQSRNNDFSPHHAQNSQNSHYGGFNAHAQPQPQAQGNTANWNGPPLGQSGMYVAVPLSMPFPAPAPKEGTTTTTTTLNEGDLTDTTTTTSNSTVPGPTDPNTTNPTINPYTAPVTVNPYLPVNMNMTMNVNGLMVPSLGLVGRTNNGLVNISPNLNGLLLSEPPLNYHLLLNQLQLPPAWSGERDLPAGPYLVLKVSCVATGYGADDRAVGHIALVDFKLNTIANVFVLPDAPITSYLTPLTSLTPALLEKYGYPLAKAVEIIRSELPKNSVLIGQNIASDLEWLGLKEGKGADCDCAATVDLRDLWRCWSTYYNSYTHYSLAHQSKCVLGVGMAEQHHSASGDGIVSMKVMQYYLWCRYYNMAMFHHKVGVLSNTVREQSFGKRNPVYEGVQMLSQRFNQQGMYTPKGTEISTATNGKEEAEMKVEDAKDVDVKDNVAVVEEQ